MDQTTGDINSRDPYFEHIPEPIPDADARSISDDQVEEGDSVTYAELTARSTTGEVTSDESSDDIREDIEQTRANMGGTIDAIQEKLSPQRLTQQAKDAVRDATIGKVEQTMNDVTDTAKESGYTLIDTIRQNPIPAALAGIGVGWLIMKVRENSERRSSYRDGGYTSQYARPQVSYQGRPGVYSANAYSGQMGRGQQVDAPSLADQAQDKLGQVTDKAQQVGGQLQDQAQQVGGQLQDQAQRVADQAQYQASRAKGWLERTMDENPLAVGLVAVAAGALAGMAVPETDQERQWMGPARDQLVDKAQDIAQDTASKAQRVAEQATNAAKNEAKNQNLIQ